MHADMVAPGFERIHSPDSPPDRIYTGIRFGEGPVWNSREGSLYWVDIAEDTIWKWTPGLGPERFIRPSGKANGLTFDRQGRLVAAGWSSRNVWRLERDGSKVTLATQCNGKKLTAPNDIVVKSDGAIYFTETSAAMTTPGFSFPGMDVQRYNDYLGVYRLSPDGSTVSLVVEDMANPNGLAFSPDESLLYVNDTRDRLIRAFDVQPDGSLANGRLFYTAVGDERGAPDGMKVDVEGNVYCTGPGGLHVVDPRGKLLGRLRTPGGHATNLCFGGPDWRWLFWTTFTTVFRVRLSIPGMPVVIE